MKEKVYVHGGKKRSSISVLFGGVTLSEPLKTFKGNVEAMVYIAQMSSYRIRGHKDQVSKLYKDGIKSKEEQEKKLREDERVLKNVLEMEAVVREKETSERSKKLAKWARETLEGIVAREKKFVDRWDSLNKGWVESLNKYEKAKENLMPMVFVYIVTIWDAFILDTVRRILRVHPQVIVGKKNATVEVKASFLWDVKSTEDIRNYLIEDKVRQLDGNRNELLKCFGDDWGIDWKMSGIKLIDIIEIRARRDIWVHNGGVVNRQYLNMVGKNGLLREGEVAQIDGEYLDECLEKLTRLAVYVHRVAEEKHYAKADIGEDR